MDRRELKVIRTVDSSILDQMQAILGFESPDPDSERNETIYQESFVFEEGFECEIKVINAGSPFVDAVLFHEDCEVFALEVRDEIRGEFCFELEDTQMIEVNVVKYIAVIQ